MNFQRDPLRFFHPVLPAARLGTKPVGVQVADTKIVLFRDSAGAPRALLDRCPHRFTPLSLGRVRPDGRLACGYHGWSFDGEGGVRNPQVDGIDMKCTLRSFQVVREHDYLWVANPDVSVDQLPYLGGEGWTFLRSYPMRFRAPFHVVFDNFSENEHFPYVHRWLGWNMANARKVQFECRRGDDYVDVVYHGPHRPVPGQRLFGIKRGSWVRNGWRTRFNPVHSVFTSWFTEGKDRDVVSANLMTLIGAFITPIGQDQTEMTIFHFARFPRGMNKLTLALLKAPIVSRVRADVLADARFTEKLGGVPYSLRGAMLGRFDKPLLHGRALLERLYLGRDDAPPAQAEAGSQQALLP